MANFDLGQARYYLQLLRGDFNTSVCWQMFNDRNSDDNYAIVYHGNIDSVLPTINEYQNKGFGAYVTINPTNGKGRHLEDIISYDWVFADIDGNRNVVDTYPLLPSFITQRDNTHGHVYWPVKNITTVKQYNYVQKLIALYLGSDEQVIDPTRVARIPGSLHLKDPTDPKMYTVVQDNRFGKGFAYTIEEIERAFTLPEEKQKILTKFISNREAKTSGDGFNDNPIYRTQLINFARDKAIPAVKGEGRSAELIRVASFGYDRGVSQEETTEILWEYYNPRCIPPWTDKEKQFFDEYIARAYRYAKNAPGCLTAGAFDWGELAPPTNGWENQVPLEIDPVNTDEELEFTPTLDDDLGYITPEVAAVNKTFITSKSSYHAMALKYIGEVYPHKTLIKFEKGYYKYNGKHWYELTEEYLLAEVYRFFACWEFPMSKINNIFEAVKQLIFEKDLKRGTYLSDPTKEVFDSITVQNGIIQIKNGAADLKPHTRDFFDLNILPYSYDPTATCEEFLEFINQQWPNNESMHKQLQEMYGLCLLPNKKHGRFALMIGKSRAGKGVHREIITTMVGSHNIAFPSLSGLLTDPTIASLAKSKLAMINEANNINSNIKTNVLDRLKLITGGDPLQYNRKYKDEATCSVWPFIVAFANEFPDFVDSSGALANRVWAFPMHITFAGREDRNLASRLCRPESISGIFNWALEGLVRVISNDYNITVSDESKRYVEDIKYDTFPLSNFIEECCILDANVKVYVDDLYDVYVAHCREKTVKYIMSKTKFGKLLDSSHLNVSKKRESSATNGKRRYYFTNLGLNDLAIQKTKHGFNPIDTDNVKSIK